MSVPDLLCEGFDEKVGLHVRADKNSRSDAAGVVFCFCSGVEKNIICGILRMAYLTEFVVTDVFDVILCNHLLEHIPDDMKAMKELYRVLKPGGWSILQSPILLEKTFEDFTVTEPKEREKIFGQADHVRKYGLDYTDRLAEAGFIVNVDDYARTMDEKLYQRYCLEKEDIYFCTKR